MDRQSRLNYIVKIASRCNLNCSYCYVYNKADTQWLGRPATMSRETFMALVGRIKTRCVASGQKKVLVCFHGGEPTLVGVERFAWMCAYARRQLDGIANVHFMIQSNATRLSPEWVAVLREHAVQISISVDGPEEIHDTYRVDHRGRGSHAAVLRGVGLLRDAGIPFGILSVVQLGAEPLPIHRHFLELGSNSISYLLPSYTHETIGPVREQFGRTPCADFLIPIFDEWWFNGSLDVSIREFWNIAQVVMGGATESEAIGNPPLGFVTVETDGGLEGLDLLRTCEDGISSIPLNVHDADFSEIARAAPFHAEVMKGLPVPTGCRACPERDTCAGGHVAQRYSKARGFDNPSVWCADLLKLFAHVRMRLGISVEETARRRAELRDLRERTLVGASEAP